MKSANTLPTPRLTEKDIIQMNTKEMAVEKLLILTKNSVNITENFPLKSIRKKTYRIRTQTIENRSYSPWNTQEEEQLFSDWNF